MIKKISSRKRIKILYTITQALGFKFWETNYAKALLEVDYGLTFTSKRNHIMYFKVTDQKKYMLFFIKYTEFIK